MKWLDSRVMVKKPMAGIASRVRLGSGDGVGTISQTNPMNAITNTPQIIHPTSYPRTHPMTVALRRVAYYWPEAHAKIMSMPWEWSDKHPYGATDGDRLFFNRTGLNRLAARDAGPGLIAFLLVHEALHVLLRHRQRFAHLRWKRILNEAADYVINAMIVRRNRELKREIFPPIDGIYLDESFSGHKSVEQIYRELILAKEKNAAIVGTVQKVLCEGPSKHNPSTLSGRTPQNKIVIFEGDVDKLTGQILEIDVKESTGFTTYGELV